MFGFGDELRFPLEIGARQVIEQDRISQVEEALLAWARADSMVARCWCRRSRLRYRGSSGRREVDAQDVGQCRGSDPVGHGVFGRGMNEPIERHREVNDTSHGLKPSDFKISSRPNRFQNSRPT